MLTTSCSDVRKVAIISCDFHTVLKHPLCAILSPPHPSFIHPPSIPHPSPIHPSFISHPSLIHPSSIPHSSPIHPSSILHPSLIHPSSIPHPSFIHPSSILHPPSFIFFISSSPIHYSSIRSTAIHPSCLHLSHTYTILQPMCLLYVCVFLSIDCLIDPFIRRWLLG